MVSVKNKKQLTWLERNAEAATRWLGSTSSLIVHSVIFVVAAIIPFFGVPFDIVLLVVTTAVSLEAIYMNIFIQMAVNKNTVDIEEIQEDVEEIAEDVDEIQEDVEEIEKDVDEIQKDIEDIEEEHEKDYTEDRKLEEREAAILTSIQTTLSDLQKEIEQLKRK